MNLTVVDSVVLFVYLLGILLVGLACARKSQSTEHFMAAGRSMAGWVVGLSIFGTFLSSITFIGNPGKAFQDNWNGWVFSLSLPLAGWIAVRVFVPFYRRGSALSAYEHLEQRFGLWARSYVSLLYLLMQVARSGMILSGVSLAVSQLTGLPMSTVIVIAGALITLYTMLGGIEAVIWTDVVQSLVLGVGALVILAMILLKLPEGPGSLMSVAGEANKLSLGSWEANFVEPTIWVMLIYGVAINLTNFGIDQSYVQRFLTAKDDAAAARSVWIGVILYVPISLVFFLIGSSLWTLDRTDERAFAELREQVIEQRVDVGTGSVDRTEETTEPSLSVPATVSDEELGDKVLPFFIVHHLPMGLTGLLIAAIIAAAMSSVDTSLNSSATVFLQDFYKRYLNAQASETVQMRVLYGATLCIGLAGIGVGLFAASHKSLLDVWWNWSGLLAGGMLGLFLLSVFAHRAWMGPALLAAILGTLVIAWVNPPAAESLPTAWREWLDSPAMSLPRQFLHKNLAGTAGTLVIFFVGWGLSWLWPRPAGSLQEE
ncbi:MAG: sodium:solute symporter [Pirellulaceae bacterium]